MSSVSFVRSVQSLGPKNTTRSFTILLFFIFALYMNAQKSPAKEIVIGTIDSLYSEILQEQREIWIQVPNDDDASKKYPIIYVLDASQHFHVITAMQKRLTPWQTPKAIIVGITNTDRMRDFTPTNVSFSRGRKTEASGGADTFLKFLKEELEPFLITRYPTEQHTTIIGHSTGGLFVLNSYLNEVDSFDNYIAIDPSLWWDKENLVSKTQTLLNTGNRKEKSLYVAVANSLGKEMDTVKVRKKKSVPTEQIRANLNFHDILVKNKEKLTFSWEYFKDEDHGSITIPAQYNGLRDVFSWFLFPEMWRFNTPKKFSAKELTAPYYAHYEKLSARMKREVKPDWDLVNDIGMYMLEGHKLPKKALAYLEMNIHFYPNESKSYVALGDFYYFQKDKKEAEIQYQKAIAIDGNQSAKDKLKGLK